MKLECLKLGDDFDWANFSKGSPQGTCYLDRAVLDLFNTNVTYYGCFKGKMLAAVLPVIDWVCDNFENLPFCYYQGPVISREIYRSSLSNVIQYELELLAALFEYVAVERAKFFSCLHTSLQDVRGVDWVHYGQNTKPRIKISPRYTAIVELASSSIQDFYKNARSSRRQEERYALEKENLSVNHFGKEKNLFQNYKTSFWKQGTNPSDFDLAMLEPFTSYFVGKGRGQIIEIKNKAGTCVASALLIRDYDEIFHVPILGVGETKYGGTLLYFEILKRAKSSGGRVVDFNGANSPKRGYFKHSIGACPKLYFEATFLNNKHDSSSEFLKNH